jgi:hypothetical protein
MSGIKRKMQRQAQKNNGGLSHKKVIAKKLGCSVQELNRRMKRREKNLKEINGGNENGKS